VVVVVVEQSDGKPRNASEKKKSVGHAAFSPCPYSVTGLAISWYIIGGDGR